MVTAKAAPKMLKQSNLITQARYDYTKVEKRIMYLIVEALNEADKETIDKAMKRGKAQFTLNFRVLLELDGMWSTDEYTNYKYIREAAKLLQSRIFQVERCVDEIIPDSEPAVMLNDIEVLDTFSLVCSSRTYPKTTTIKIWVDSMILPFFCELKNNYTTYEKFNALFLQSKYSQRLYELFSQYNNPTSRWYKTSIVNLRDMLGISDSYNIGTLQTRILKPALKELYENTEISASYQMKKTGREFTDIEFKIFNNVKNLELLTRPINSSSTINIMSSKLAGYQLTESQILTIARTVAPKDIEATLTEFTKIKQGTPIKNNGGYLWTMFKQRYNLIISSDKLAA